MADGGAAAARVAKRELRQLRVEARESGKLLKDKRALEIRCQELQEILETVQNQRNDLRSQLREEKTAVAAMRESLATATAERDSLSTQMETAATLASERETSLKVPPPPPPPTHPLRPLLPRPSWSLPFIVDQYFVST